MFICTKKKEKTYLQQEKNKNKTQTNAVEILFNIKLWLLKQEKKLYGCRQAHFEKNVRKI